MEYSTYKNSIKNPKVKIVKKETVYDGYFRMDKYFLSYSQYNGKMSEPVSREILERGHAVGIIPYDPKTDEVILIEQFRPGAFLANENAWLLEIPAGIIEKGEDKKDVAVRETKEETGLEVIDIKPLLSHIATPGGCTETLQLYIAKVDANKAFDFAGLDEEGEDIKIIKTSVDEAIKLLDENKFFNATSIISMQWLALNRDKLKDIFS